MGSLELVGEKIYQWRCEKQRTSVLSRPVTILGLDGSIQPHSFPHCSCHCFICYFLLFSQPHWWYAQIYLVFLDKL